MKCDELNKVIGMVCERERYYYNANKVDEAFEELIAENVEIQKQTDIAWGKVNAMYDEISELKARIHELENMPHTDNSAVIELLENENAQLKESRQAWIARAGVAEENLAKLEKELAELREATRWRKCSEELPTIGQEVIFLAKYKTDSIIKWLGDYRRDIFYTSCPGWGCEFLPSEIIGWMPQPKAPEVK